MEGEAPMSVSTETLSELDWKRRFETPRTGFADVTCTIVKSSAPFPVGKL